MTKVFLLHIYYIYKCNSIFFKNGPAKEKYHLREKPKNDDLGGGCHYRLLTHQSNSTWSLLRVYFVSTWCILDVKAPYDWIRWLPNVQTRSTSLTWCILGVYLVSTSCLLRVYLGPVGLLGYCQKIVGLCQ